MSVAGSGSEVGAILFTDLVGFTEYNSVAGDDQALAVLDTQTAMVAAVLEPLPSARIVKELGDGLMVWFASAMTALHSTLEVMAKVEHDRREAAFPLSMRLGLHHGEVLARGDDLVGLTVNIAARVCDLAGPGELLVSQALIDRCDDLPDGVDPIGPTRVKGVEEPIWLHRIAR